MSVVTYDVAYTESRNRLTTLFRLILLIPHAILLNVWGSLARVLALLQWFTILFTGKRNPSLWKMQNDYLGYETRVFSYGLLLHDVFPPFGTEQGDTGVSYAMEYEEAANRLTSALRLIWAIPSMIITLALMVAAEVVTFLAWFAILFTGKHPRGMFDFVVKSYRYAARNTSYLLLMTDTYPKYE
jgi:hypothetical protein